MSPFVEKLVAAAAIVYLLERAKTGVDALIDAINVRGLRALDTLHRETRAEIRPTFDLWWEDGQKQKALQGLRKKLGNEVVDMDDQVLESTMATPLSDIKAAAWHLAVHVYMNNKEAKLIAKMPNIGGVRDRMIAGQKTHEDDLDRATTGLIEYGIDPTALQRYFSFPSAS